MHALVRVFALAVSLSTVMFTSLSGSAMAAQVVVLSGQTDKLAPGSVVDAETKISLVAGQSLVINDENGATRTLVGPYDGPIGGSADRTQSGSIADNFSRLLSAPKSEQGRLGASRTVLMSAPADNHAQTAEEVMLIDVSQPGKLCVNASGQPWLWRADSLDTNSRLTITNIARNQSEAVF